MPSEPVPGRTRRRSVRRTAPLGAAAAPAWAESAGGVVWVGVPANMFVGTAEKLGLPALAAQGSNVTAGFHCDRSGIRRGFAEPSRAQTGKNAVQVPGRSVCLSAPLVVRGRGDKRRLGLGRGDHGGDEGGTGGVFRPNNDGARGRGVGCFTTCPCVG